MSESTSGNPPSLYGSARVEGCWRLANKLRAESGLGAVWSRGERPLPSRPGAVLAAVTSILLGADGPRSVSEVYADVVNATGTVIPRSSVKTALSSHCRGADARFRRVGFGVYESRPHL